METNSLINYAYAGAKPPIPEVGMGVTVLHWTYRSAGTITYVSPSRKTIHFKKDRAIRIDANGMSESQRYRYEADPSAPEQIAQLTNLGWRTKNNRLSLGHRAAYRDCSF